MEAAMPISDMNVQAWLTRQLDWERDLNRLRDRAQAEHSASPATANEATPVRRRSRRWAGLPARLAMPRSPVRGISGRRRGVTISR
jgi:hypothetical protein